MQQASRKRRKRPNKHRVKVPTGGKVSIQVVDAVAIAVEKLLTQGKDDLVLYLCRLANGSNESQVLERVFKDAGLDCDGEVGPIAKAILKVVGGMPDKIVVVWKVKKRNFRRVSRTRKTY